MLNSPCFDTEATTLATLKINIGYYFDENSPPDPQSRATSIKDSEQELFKNKLLPRAHLCCQNHLGTDKHPEAHKGHAPVHTSY